jgi:hypothetical protein
MAENNRLSAIRILIDVDVPRVLFTDSNYDTSTLLMAKSFRKSRTA